MGGGGGGGKDSSHINASWRGKITVINKTTRITKINTCAFPLIQKDKGMLGTMIVRFKVLPHKLLMDLCQQKTTFVRVWPFLCESW